MNQILVGTCENFAHPSEKRAFMALRDAFPLLQNYYKIILLLLLNREVQGEMSFTDPLFSSSSLPSSSLPWSLLVRLCLQRYCTWQVHHHLPAPLCAIILSYVREALTDETLHDAVITWCYVPLKRGELIQRYGHISHWDVSRVTDMRELFFGCSSFNDNIEHWDVSNVTDMSRLFADAKVFNQPLHRWDVSKVEDMSGMFHSAFSFNQPIGTWDVRHVKNMSNMFHSAQLFNQSVA